MKSCRHTSCRSVARAALVGSLGLLVVAPGCMPAGQVSGDPASVRAPAPGGSGGAAGHLGKGGGPGGHLGNGGGNGGGSGDGSGGGSGSLPPPPDGGPSGAPVDPDAAGNADAGGAGDGAAPESDAGGGPPGPLARDIALGLIEGAQGVFVPLVRAGALVPPADRKTDLIEGRPLFIRIHVVPGKTFAARPLRAVLTVTSDDQPTPARFEDSKMIAEASRSDDLASTFNFLLPKEAVLPSSRFAVSLHETAPVASPEPAPAPRFPAPDQADAALAIKAGKMELDLVLVRATGVGGPLMDSPERRQRVESYLYDVYPVQKLNVRWRDPVKFTKKISRNDGFATLQQLRTMDGAKPHEYYHLLVAVEDTVETLLGIAELAGATAADGPRRIGMTFVRKRSIDSELDSISHEMGHNHGRNHVAGCNAQGIDPQYPYPNTAVGVDGYSLSENAFKPAAMYKDLMGYCYPTWISDYTFDAFSRRVRAVTSFATGPGGAPVTMLGERSLQGFASRARGGALLGLPLWGVVDAALVGPDEQPTATRGAQVWLSDGSKVATAVTVRSLGDDGLGAEIAVALPPSGELQRIEIRLDGQSYTLDAADHFWP